MSVPFGTVQRATPSEAATARPAPEAAETASGAFVLLYSSMYSSCAPEGPRKRNSLMIRLPATGGVPVSSFVMVTVAVAGEPSAAPITFPSSTLNVSSVSKNDSLQMVTLKVLGAASVSAQLSVPLVVTKSTPGVQLAPPVAVPFDVL